MNKYYIILALTALFFSSCDHTTTCKIPVPVFDSLTKSVKTSSTVQMIEAKSYDPLATYTWYLLKTPTSLKTSIVSQAKNPTLEYTFNQEGDYNFGLVSNKYYDCKSDSTIFTIHSSKTNTSGGGGGPCTALPTGKNFKLQTTYYASINTPGLSGSSSTYLYSGLYDNTGNTVYFYFPKTFSTSPIFSDYTINGSKTYSSLSGTECAIEIKGARYSAQNPSAAVVHITQGTTKTFALSVCNFQYIVNGTTYTLEAKFEFN